MAVIETKQTPEQEESSALDEKALADKLIQQISLPESLTAAIDEAEKKEAETEQEEESEVQEEPIKEEKTEEVVEEKDEELIPKSTFQKRLDEMTREKKMLELRLQRLEADKFNAPAQRDEDTEKLEKMSLEELENLKDQVRMTQFDSVNDKPLLNKLLILEKKIDSTIRIAPIRFAQTQVSKFNEAVQMSAQELPNFEKVQKDIFTLASRFYESAPELKASVTGQARAWNLAIEHYKTMQELQAGKSKLTELDRQVNTLKKKVSVSGTSRKASVTDTDETAKLFKRAKNGEIGDKLEFIRRRMGTDASIDNFLEGHNKE